MSTKQWIRTASRYLFESRWYAVRQDELVSSESHAITYTIVEHPGFVVIVPLLPDGRVVMERIYRYPLQRVQLECPSGGLDGETPEIAARRELEEETGYRADRLIDLGKYAASSGISDEEFFVFLATDVTADGVLRREITEDIEIELIPLNDLRVMVLRGEVVDAPSALAILLASEVVNMKIATES
ncbi:MAG TPA: NUDIX hydrolase [Anaerolineae bacterium]|nr:NUDIX hydrolase [Anaerolineae bacterium]